MEVDRKRYPHQFGPDFCTDMKVLRSAAGFYLGRLYFDVEVGCELPYSRESDYFATREQAERALQQGFKVRQADENAHLPEPHQPEHN